VYGEIWAVSASDEKKDGNRVILSGDENSDTNNQDSVMVAVSAPVKPVKVNVGIGAIKRTETLELDGIGDGDGGGNGNSNVGDENVDPLNVTQKGGVMNPNISPVNRSNYQAEEKLPVDVRTFGTDRKNKCHNLLVHLKHPWKTIPGVGEEGKLEIDIKLTLLGT
jgi:hypothetical protein